MIPRWHLSPEGIAAVRARAAELRAYLRIRRAMRAAKGL